MVQRNFPVNLIEDEVPPTKPSMPFSGSNLLSLSRWVKTRQGDWKKKDKENEDGVFQEYVVATLGVMAAQNITETEEKSGYMK